MDPIYIIAYLILAVIPQYLSVIPVTLALVIFWAPLAAWAYVSLGKDFARNHPFIVLGMLATGAVHFTYAIWGHIASTGEAPLELGAAVLAGYVVTLIGLIQAFIQENQTATGNS